MVETVKFKRLRDDALLPYRVSKESAAFDALVPVTTRLSFGRQIIPLGWAVAMHPSLSLNCRTRAGYAAKGLLVIDAFGQDTRLDADVILGLIDSDYRGEIGVILNVRDERVKYKYFYLQQGQAVAQLEFSYVPQVLLVETDELDETLRSDRGFGEMNGE